MVHHIISECFKFKLRQNCTHNMQDKTAETHNMQDKTAETQNVLLEVGYTSKQVTFVSTLYSNSVRDIKN